MEDKSKIIYGNEIGRKAYRNAIHSKKKFIKKYGDDTGTKYPAGNSTIISVLKGKL